MKTTSVTKMILLGALVTACATDVSYDDEEIASDSSFLKIGPTAPPVGPVGPVAPPEPPPILGKIARISSADLNFDLTVLLHDTRLVIDTTDSSPTILGDPVYLCSYPNLQAREEATAECMQLAGSARSACLQQVNEDFPNIKECSWQRPPVHSYIKFGDLAKEYGAVDVPFNGIETIHRDSWGPGGVAIDINHIRATVGPTTLKAYFVPELSGNATARVSLALTSNKPTLPCDHTVLTCPDVELTDMNLIVGLTNILPKWNDATQLTFSSAEAYLLFDRNLNNIPDVFATLFVDVDDIIRNNVKKNVVAALERDSSRAVLNKALTTLVKRRIGEGPMAAGVKHFYRTWYDAGDLVVDYEPCIGAGCSMSL